MKIIEHENGVETRIEYKDRFELTMNNIESIIENAKKLYYEPDIIGVAMNGKTINLLKEKIDVVPREVSIIERFCGIDVYESSKIPDYIIKPIKTKEELKQLREDGQ